MDASYTFQPQTAPAQRKAGWRMWFLVALAAFAAGGGLTIWLTGQSGSASLLSDVFNLRSEDDLAGGALAQPEPMPSAAESTAVVAEARQAVAVVERVAEQQGGLDARIAAMEQRITRLDLQAQAAAGNAARAEGLLIAFATRRALERGAPLGYLADQLRLRFGDARPNAVNTVIAVSRDPVTLEMLLSGLDALTPELAEAPSEEGFLTRIRREISSAFVVRREDTPSPASERRLERARLFLQSGRVSDALIEVRNLPNAQAAAEWIGDARRYADAHAALELLETAAVLDQRELRDGDGARVEQASPAE